jgi:hypothetical protein
MLHVYGDPDLKFGGLSIWALCRERPDSEDFCDGNWIHAHACVEAAGAQIDIHGPWLRSDEIESFQRELTSLNQNLTGGAELSCMEPYLRVAVTCRSPGALEVVVEITPDLMTQEHRFIMMLDQTYLRLALEGCQRILAKYPVKNAASRQPT